MSIDSRLGKCGRFSIFDLGAKNSVTKVGADYGRTGLPAGMPWICDADFEAINAESFYGQLDLVKGILTILLLFAACTFSVTCRVPWKANRGGPMKISHIREVPAIY
jgi:hypothetical protein